MEKLESRKPSIVLQERDTKLLRFLCFHGQALGESLARSFFDSNLNAFYKRVHILKKEGLVESKKYLEMLGFLQKKSSKFLNILSHSEIKPSTQIYIPTKKVMELYNFTHQTMRPHQVTHQLLLAKVQSKLSPLLIGESSISHEPLVKLENEFTLGRDQALVPDLIYKSGELNLAIELERVPKSLGRYLKKSGLYFSSNFTHILYVCLDEMTLRTLLRVFSSNLNAAVSLVSEPDQLHTRHFGRLQFKEWIKKDFKND